MSRVFHYRGHTLEQLQQMSMDEFIMLLPSKTKRKISRGLPPAHRKLLSEIRATKRGEGSGKPLKTHCRDMLILPEIVSVTVAVHNGKEFVNVEIKPEMIGHLLGEFAITTKKVSHGNPGIGASRSSMYVPLK